MLNFTFGPLHKGHMTSVLGALKVIAVGGDTVALEAQVARRLERMGYGVIV